MLCSDLHADVEVSAEAIVLTNSADPLQIALPEPGHTKATSPLHTTYPPPQAYCITASVHVDEPKQLVSRGQLIPNTRSYACPHATHRRVGLLSPASPSVVRCRSPRAPSAPPREAAGTCATIPKPAITSRGEELRSSTLVHTYQVARRRRTCRRLRLPSNLGTC